MRKKKRQEFQNKIVLSVQLVIDTGVVDIT